MSSDKYELQTMEPIAPDVLFMWTLGFLAEYLRISKRKLKKAKKIMDMPEFEDIILVGKQEKKCTFYFGYREFYLLIKNKRRHILAPHPIIQEVFRAIKERFAELYPAHKNAYGFVKKRNFQMAVETLTKETHFFSYDISNAFPSITNEMVKKTLTDLSVFEYLVDVLAEFVTYKYKGLKRLPQGASSSPVILNMVYKPMCDEIEAYCQKKNLSWCVYVDDFTFAGETITSEMKKDLSAIPEKYGFKIKKSKTKDNQGNTIFHALGLTIVNGEVHLKRKTKKKFRRMLYLAWKYDEYNYKQINGITGVIKQVYGEPKNWPNSLRKYWVLYMNANPKSKRREKE